MSAHKELWMRYGLFESNRGSFADRTAFPAQSSVLDEQALLHRVVPQYGLPTPTDCLFLERGDSDVYQVHTVGPTFYLKIYRPPHPTGQTEAEGRLVAALAAHGASVVAAVPRRDGAYATEIAASEGPRPALLFEQAPAHKIEIGDVDACRHLGTAVATLHLAGDAIAPEAVAVFPPTDLLPFVERLAYEQDYSTLRALQQELRARLDAFPDGAADQDAGWCHNDLVLGNIRCREDGSIVFLDFGNAGWLPRANELVRVRHTLRRHAAPERFNTLWTAFVDGYSQARAVPEVAVHSEEALVVDALRRIGWIGGVMASCPLRMGTEGFNRAWVREQLRAVQESVAGILETAP
jgi:Ser/Thr protein kinase RdoA (MazF antagonist)